MIERSCDNKTLGDYYFRSQTPFIVDVTRITEYERNRESIVNCPIGIVERFYQYGNLSDLPNHGVEETLIQPLEELCKRGFEPVMQSTAMARTSHERNPKMRIRYHPNAGGRHVFRERHG